MKSFVKTLKNQKFPAIKVSEEEAQADAQTPVVLPLPDHLSSFGETCQALVNNLTVQKDYNLVITYMTKFLQFLASGGSLALPMFTAPADPSFVKRVVFELDVPSTRNTPTIVQVIPFSSGKSIVVASGNIHYPMKKEAVACFTRFRVVACRVSFRQVGITAINDTLGTVIDAAVAPSNVSTTFLQEHMLSLQLPQGKLITMVPGKDGVCAMLLGSPDFPPCYPGNFCLVPNRVHSSYEADVSDVPAGSLIVPVRATGNLELTPEISFNGGSWQVVPTVVNLVETPARIRGGAIMVQDPAGEQVFIKASPAPDGINFRLVVEFIIQGQLTPEMALTLPQVTPHNTFDFARLKYAWENVLPSVGPYPFITAKAQKMSSINGIKGVAYASNKPINPQNEIKENPGYFAPKWSLPIKAAPTTDTPINLPEWVKEAIKFTGDVVTRVKTTANSSRFARSAVTPLPPCTYQYFPMIEGEKGEPVLGIVAVKVGAFAKSRVRVDALTLNKDEPKKQMYVYYDPKDFDKTNDFYESLNVVTAMVYGPWRQPAPDNITIRFFSEYKVAGNSYMLALTAALVGTPSGGFYTGSYELDKVGNPIPHQMDEKVLETKLRLASTTCPLVVLSSGLLDVNSGIVVGGLVNAIYGGKAITCADCGEAFTNMMLPLRVKSVKTTPLEALTQEATRYLTMEGALPHRRYIALLTMNPLKRYDVAVGVAQMGKRDFARSDPSNFTTVINRNGRAWVAKDFYAKYPNLKMDKSLFPFEYGGNLYVNPYVFMGHARSVGFPYMVEFNDDLAKANSENIKRLTEITQDDLDTLLQEERRRGSPKPFTANQTVAELFVSPAQSKPVEEAWKQLAELAKGFDAVLAHVMGVAQKYNGSASAFIMEKEGGDFLSNVGIPTRVSKEGAAAAASDPALNYISKMLRTLRAAPSICIAQASGWGHMFGKPNPKLATLQAAIKFLGSNPVPKVELDQDAQENLNASSQMRAFQDRMNPQLPTSTINFVPNPPSSSNLMDKANPMYQNPLSQFKPPSAMPLSSQLQNFDFNQEE